MPTEGIPVSLWAGRLSRNNKTATMNQLKEEWKIWVERFKHKSDSLNIIVNDFSNLKLNVK